ncbi:hypothetical protein BGZ61DRAFT_536946 [Ilyonectria robusta]|uniref:uncharacterized protein n=1 Tax=Ilyonectria robusta TaxID=1079257 RepID=UPI001E8E9908|nr:uncharacterized protein BGZ61DRAFT_536946 [Ilyonectria robusta]KAH8672300.1 hypothetical protein BGZ61DRAFT_536946 [Ilyonectria robusta]
MTLNVDLPSKPLFSLIDHDGRAVSTADFYGKHLLVFFGFTNCQLVCPRALERLTEAVNRLGPAASRVVPLYISVDPERDSPDVMKEFLADRAPVFTGLTGTKEQVNSARDAFRVFAKRRDDDNAPGGYSIPHTAITYVVGPDGRLLDHLMDSVDASGVVERMWKILAQNLDQPNTHELDNELATDSTKETVSKGLNGNKQESLDLLDKKQVTSIRHIGNLARQLKGDWSNMMGPSDLNDGFGAYRFQLAYAAYSLALAHFHRLPAAPGLFKPTFERMIEKMCHPDVWYYWRDASTGGGPAQTPRSEGSVNPVEKDNIMYSAYLQTMTLLFNSLFDDDRYTNPGALTLKYEPYFWGETEGFRFEYDQNSLNKVVYWNMVEHGFLGVPCEPYCVFQICNQPPIIGFRLHDELNGGNTANEATAGYIKAWEDYGGSLDEKGDFKLFVTLHEPHIIPSPGPGMDAWCATLMHSWNPDFVNENYKRQRDKWLVHHEDGTLSVKVNLAAAMSLNTTRLLKSGEFGWVAALAAEMGDKDTLNRLLAYADKNFSPGLQNGGLTYPRNDSMFDENGRYILSPPIQANALLPLARLNVPNGFQRLYSQPWSPRNKAHYKEPALTEVDFSIDVYRAVYMSSRPALLFDLAVYETNTSGSVVLSRVFGRGPWVLKRDGCDIAWGDGAKMTGCGAQVEVEQEGEALRIVISDVKVVSFVMEWSL